MSALPPANAAQKRRLLEAEHWICVERARYYTESHRQTEGLHPSLRAALKDAFGYDSFRPGQEQVIEAVLAGRDCVAIMPTGAGKSLCFQLPALLLPGPTLVLMPLLSLLSDQLRKMTDAGISVGALRGGLGPQEKEKLFRGMRCARLICEHLKALPL